MSEPFITYQGVVYPWHCDHMGHMNVMWYVGKFDEATWRFFAYLGLSRTALAAAQRGMAAVEQHITYLRELHAGDTVTVSSAVVNVTAKALQFRHEMRNDETGVLAAVSVTTGVHLDAVARRACQLPDAVRDFASGLIAPAAMRAPEPV
jgi:acyl-CoA thioester hydrolase